jgi:vacuolar-type H+-ATPase subunit H
MIEEFIEKLQQAEAEADGIVKSAKEKVRAIERDSDSARAKDKASVELSLQQRLGAIDQKMDQQTKLARDQLGRDLKEQLEILERQAQDHRLAALDLLLSRLTSR